MKVLVQLSPIVIADLARCVPLCVHPVAREQADQLVLAAIGTAYDAQTGRFQATLDKATANSLFNLLLRIRDDSCAGKVDGHVDDLEVAAEHVQRAIYEAEEAHRSSRGPDAMERMIHERGRRAFGFAT